MTMKKAGSARWSPGGLAGLFDVPGTEIRPDPRHPDRNIHVSQRPIFCPRCPHDFGRHLHNEPARIVGAVR
jgi:hypothetical protein